MNEYDDDFDDAYPDDDDDFDNDMDDDQGRGDDIFDDTDDNYPDTGDDQESPPPASTPTYYPTRNQQYQPPQPQQQPVTVDDLLQVVDRQVNQKAQSIIQQQQDQQRMVEAEKRIMSEYPDLNNQQSPMFKWTAYILHTRYGGDLRYAEEAAMRAADRIGAMPRSRQQQRQPLQKPRVKLSKKSIRFAKEFGQKIEDVEKMATYMRGKY